MNESYIEKAIEIVTNSFTGFQSITRITTRDPYHSKTDIIKLTVNIKGDIKIAFKEYQVCNKKLVQNIPQPVRNQILLNYNII